MRIKHLSVKEKNTDEQQEAEPSLGLYLDTYAMLQFSDLIKLCAKGVMIHGEPMSRAVQ